MEAINIANVGSHNARAAQIRRFVALPPKRATTLRLVTAEDPPQQLGEWDVSQAQNNNSLSLEVSALLEEHTATVQRPTEAILGWTVGEKTVASKRLRARYVPPPDEEGDEEKDQLRFEAMGINGTTVGQVIQMQRHIEVRERTSNVFLQGLMNTAMQLNAQLQAQLQDSYTRIHELQQQQIDAAAATVAEFSEQVAAGAAPPEAEPDAATAARTHAIEVITGIATTYGPTLIQAALARIMAPKAAIQLAPPSPPAGPAPPSSSAPPAPAPAPVAPSSSAPPTSPVAPAPAATAAAAPTPPAPPNTRPSSTRPRVQRGTTQRAAPPRRTR